MLRAPDAAAAALFGGAPIEDARWKIVATSVPFDRGEWPFPQFARRGAFGRSWMRLTYDPQTMAVCEGETVDRSSARGLPDGRFAGALELEMLLRERICGTLTREPLAVYEVHAGFSPAALELLSCGGRIQFSEPLSAQEMRTIADFIERNAGDVELGVQGFLTQPFDVGSILPVRALRSLILDARLCENAEALQTLPCLQRLRIGKRDGTPQFDFLPRLGRLRELEVHGASAGPSAIAGCASLERLTLVDTPALDVAALTSAATLRELAVAHTAQPLRSIAALSELARLELRDMQLSALPDFSRNAGLESIVLRNVTELNDLRPLATARALRELEITGVPQFNVEDFEPLTACTALQRVHVDLGSRGKTREVYRLLQVGTKQHEVFRN